MLSGYRGGYNDGSGQNVEGMQGAGKGFAGGLKGERKARKWVMVKE